MKRKNIPEQYVIVCVNILQVTNTYAPVVGGVTRSVQTFTAAYSALGHRVMIVAPHIEGESFDEPNVVRVPSLQTALIEPFSMPLPALPKSIAKAIEAFAPDIIHSHHPFFLGSAALRIAAQWNVPVVYTRHTRYEEYGRYVNAESENVRRLLAALADGYGELCDTVIVPSESMAASIRERGIETRLAVIPTGIDLAHFGSGNGAAFRTVFGIPRDAFVAGHAGRIAPEKNIAFLSKALAEFAARNPQAHVLIVGTGPAQEEIAERFRGADAQDRLHMAGSLALPLLPHAYRAMDAFAFASKSETQGLVLAEAMAAGTPVVALNATGTCDIVKDEKNGRLLTVEQIQSFVAALQEIANMPPKERTTMRRAARRTAAEYGDSACAEQALGLYRSLIAKRRRVHPVEESAWAGVMHRLQQEWNIVSNVISAAVESLIADRS